MASNRIYLQGSQAQCEAYNDLVYTSEFQEVGTERWALIIERDGDFYIIGHSDYPAPNGMTKVDSLPPISEDI